MSQTVRLDNVAHAELRVHRSHGSEFGEAINQVAVFASEFEPLQRHYPILFHQADDGQLQPMAILGLDRDENLFLEAGTWAGKWNADYVPALFRRGPFMISQDEDTDLPIHVDLGSPRIADGSDHGEPVFLPHGGMAPALTKAIEALRVIHAGARMTPAMTRLFTELELVQFARLEVNISDDESYAFEGYGVVTLDRIAALQTADLERLNQSGFLSHAVFAAGSLGNLNRLAARKRQRANSA
jgi:hypothetical protein